MGDSPRAVQPPPVPERLDHLLLATPDVNATVEEVARRFGVRPVVGGRHLAWGTRNALLGLGPRRYLEIVGPDEHPEPGASPLGTRFAELGSPRLVTWVATSNALERDAARALESGVDLGAIVAGRRQRADGTELSWRMSDLHTERLGGAVPFLIDWGASPHPADSLPAGGTVASLVARHPDPGSVQRALAAIGVALEVEAADRPGLVAILDTPAGRVELS